MKKALKKQPFNPAMVPWDGYQYTVYAREFGWTPAQVDELPLDADKWLLPIHGLLKQMETPEPKAARKGPGSGHQREH